MPGAFSIGDWRVDPSLRTISSATREVRLEPKQIEVLVELAAHAGQVVSKERLLQTVWAGTFVGDEVLSRAISELRRVLEDDPKAPRFIQTIPKGGYRLIAPVDRSAAADNSTTAPSDPRWRTAWMRNVVVGILALVATAAAGWRVARTGGLGNSAPLPPMVTRLLTTLPGAEGSPSFSPDGTRITFASSPGLGTESRILVKVIGDDPAQELTRGARDDSPAWSPDGRWIAFARDDATSGGLYIVPAIGGPARRLHSAPPCGGPAWSPDGRSLVFSAGYPISCGLFQISLDTLEARQLTSGGWDSSPTFSPDGKTLSFVRGVNYVADLYLLPSGGGTPKRLTFDNKEIGGRAAWTADGREILFASSRGGSPEVWRVASTGGQPQRLQVAATPSHGLAIDLSGRRMAFEVGRTFHMHMSAFDLRRPASPPVSVAESSRSEHSAAFSSDSSRIAFSSDRAGDAADIWVADADGNNPIRVSNFARGVSGSPTWSPDGEWLAFDAGSEGQFEIYIVRAAGGSPRRLTTEKSDDFGPSWSRDGRWIYFGSNRSGREQVWKMPASGGAAVQITKDGGRCGFESADGEFFYYTRAGVDGIWRIPVRGGPEAQQIAEYPQATGQYGRYWALVDGGIYYLNTRDKEHPSVEFLRFSTGQIEPVLVLPRPPCPDWSPSLAVSPDQRTLLTCFESQGDSDIMLIENFR